jgi:Ca2+-binding EF-hand superfamily protein
MLVQNNCAPSFEGSYPFINREKGVSIFLKALEKSVLNFGCVISLIAATSKSFHFKIRSNLNHQQNRHSPSIAIIPSSENCRPSPTFCELRQMSTDRVFLNLESLLSRLREKIQSRGAIGIEGLGRLFRIADDDGNRTIDLKNEFPKLLADIGILLNKTELSELSRLLDRDGDGVITYEEFIYFLAPPLNAFRLRLVNEAFDFLDKNHNGIIDINDFRNIHAETRSPRESAAEVIFGNFLLCFDKDGSGQTTRQEFIDYYREINPNIPNDEYFETLIRAAWKWPRGKIN